MEKRCIFCEERFETKFKRKRYCSKECQLENKTIKERLKNFKLQDKKCEVCGRVTLGKQIIHHINRNHNDNRKENRIGICRDCHIAIHNGIGTSRYKRKGIRKSKDRMFSNSNYLIINKLKELSNRLK